MQPDCLSLAAEPVSEVTIRSDLAEAIEHNSTLVLSCSARGSFLQFSWTNGTRPLVPDGRRITLREVGPAHSHATLNQSGPKGGGANEDGQSGFCCFKH